jgi:hypothetical protein
MLKLFGGLAKAVVAVAVTPVALAVDVVTAPAKLVSDDPNVKMFGATEACLKEAGRGVGEAGKS